MDKDLPRILFITVNGWNNTTGTSTISSIIEGYPPEKIANIFIRTNEPNSLCCKHYYRISEQAVLQSVFFRNKTTGYMINQITDEESNSFQTERVKQNNLKKYKNCLTPYFRDMIWALGNWYSDDLKNFVKSFKPQIIVMPAEGWIHFNKIGLAIKKDFQVPLGLYFWDDNFTYKSITSIFNQPYRFFLRKNIIRLVQEAEFGFSISPKMQKECMEQLNFKTTLLTKPMLVHSGENSRVTTGVVHILYTGSVYIGRENSLLKLINCISQLRCIGIKYKLDIYTNSNIDRKLFAKLNVQDISEVHPAVTKEEVLELQKKADVEMSIKVQSKFTPNFWGVRNFFCKLSFCGKIYIFQGRAFVLPSYNIS